ncbi:MAG: nuclear transport factor 2 family protein [Desulfurococcales archaeon]|nr:nuclear transport factor 2 family protein [Desulfurococcales archaeon]
MRGTRPSKPFIVPLLATLTLLAAVAIAVQVAAGETPLQAQESMVDPLMIAKLEALAHWMYIAGEDLDSIMTQYSEDVELYWVGGPLTGIYHGVDEVRGVWERFFTGNEDEFVRATNVKVLSLEDGEYSVVADVSFEVTRAATGDRIVLNLKYIILFTETPEGLKITEEWWIIEGVERA